MTENGPEGLLVPRLAEQQLGKQRPRLKIADAVYQPHGVEHRVGRAEIVYLALKKWCHSLRAPFRPVNGQAAAKKARVPRMRRTINIRHSLTPLRRQERQRKAMGKKAWDWTEALLACIFFSFNHITIT